MSADLKNSETLKNLMCSFAGESQARNRYTFAAGLCQKQQFHVLEAVISVALVVAFVFMMQRVFAGQGQDLLYWIPFAVAAVGDAVLLWMRWQESVNSFVLIFVSLTAVLFAVGKILFRVIGEK